MTTVTLTSEELAILTSAMHWRNRYYQHRINKLTRKIAAGKAGDPQLAEYSLLGRKRSQNQRTDLELKLKMLAGAAYRGDQVETYKPTAKYEC